MALGLAMRHLAYGMFVDMTLGGAFYYFHSRAWCFSSYAIYHIRNMPS
jgi:hypothetical protein